MRIFAKPLIQWREPDEVRWLRWAADTRRRGLVLTAIAFSDLGVLIAFLNRNADWSDAPLVPWSAGASFMIALWGVLTWLWRREPRRFRAWPHKEMRGRVRARMPLAAVAGRHPLCPRHRALGLEEGKGRTFVVGIPDDVSDEMIRLAWPQSEYANVPLSFTSDVIEWTESPLPKEIAFFRWPDGPAYWPLGAGNLMWYGRLAVLAALALSPVIAILLRFSPISLLVSIPLLAALGIVGWITGWNDNAIVAVPYGLTLSSGVRRSVRIPWGELDAVTLLLSPYEGVADWIVAEYHYRSYATDDEFTMRIRSKRFKYERFVSALSEHTGCAVDIGETPEGLMIKLTGFAHSSEATGVAGEKAPKQAG